MSQKQLHIQSSKTLATILRHIHVAQSPTIVLKTTPRQTTKQAQPAVIFDMHDYMHTHTINCKFTLVGELCTTKPKVELIRKSFI